MWDCSLGRMARGEVGGWGGGRLKERKRCGGKILACEGRIVIGLICQGKKGTMG